MSTADDIQQLVDKLASEQYTLGQSDQLNLDHVEISQLETSVVGLKATIAELEHELAIARTPVGYTEVDAKNLQGAVDSGIRAFVRGEADFANLKVPVPGMDIWLADEAVLWKNSDNADGGTKASFITNRDWTKPTGPVTIRGAGRITAKSGMRGNIVGVWCSALTLLDWTCDNWLKGRLIFPGVDGKLTIGRIKYTADKTAGSGSGGVRPSHTGSGEIWGINDSSSGDDNICPVPAGNPNDPLFNKGDIRDLWIHDCHRLVSYDGRVLAHGLQDSADDKTTRLGMKSGIHGIREENIDGFGGKSGYVIQNKSSTNTIDGITTKNVIIDQSQAATSGETGQPSDIWVYGADATGGVRDCDLGGVTLLHQRPNKQAYIAKDNVINITPPKVA